MKLINFIPLANFTGGIIATVISIVVSFAIIGALIFYVQRSKKQKNMVHNRKKPNDNPEKKR
jgi:mannitol-specific phosphotransferase system IIBC component